MSLETVLRPLVPKSEEVATVPDCQDFALELSSHDFVRTVEEVTLDVSQNKGLQLELQDGSELLVICSENVFDIILRNYTLENIDRRKCVEILKAIASGSYRQERIGRKHVILRIAGMSFNSWHDEFELGEPLV